VIRPASFAIALALLAGGGCAAPKPTPSKTSPLDACHPMNVGAGLRYDCDGYTAAFHDAPPDAAVDARHELDEMVAGLVDGFKSLTERYNAKIRVHKAAREIEGKAVLSAEVTVDHPTTTGMYYGGGYAIVAGRRDIICSASTGVGMERCGPVIRYLLEDR
jgi:hypothetical protein